MSELSAISFQLSALSEKQSQSSRIQLPMSYQIKVETLSPRVLAAVRRRVAPKDVPVAFKPALDKVWAFLGAHKGLRTDGHNIFLYHHENPALMPVDFGVEVVRPFPPEGEVDCVTTAAGEAAVVVH